MIRIQQDISVAEAMDKILADMAAVPPSRYEKQLFIQIHNEALQDKAFCDEIEREIEDEFSSPPRLDEIYDFVNEMLPTLADILDRYGIRKRAREFAKLAKMAS